MSLRPDLAIIAANVAAGSRVLDVGCGDGAL
ncbi:MAG TPA: methionine biosynthesis protein MetW, partial [Sphingomonas sp.]|nr:methionine biosynthesis protein MetW [Sphingomonas sp.]